MLKYTNHLVSLFTVTLITSSKEADLPIVWFGSKPPCFDLHSGQASPFLCWVACRLMAATDKLWLESVVSPGSLLPLGTRSSGVVYGRVAPHPPCLQPSSEGCFLQKSRRRVEITLKLPIPRLVLETRNQRFSTTDVLVKHWPAIDDYEQSDERCITFKRCLSSNISVCRALWQHCSIASYNHSCFLFRTDTGPHSHTIYYTRLDTSFG